MEESWLRSSQNLQFSAPTRTCSISSKHRRARSLSRTNCGSSTPTFSPSKDDLLHRSPLAHDPNRLHGGHWLRRMRCMSPLVRGRAVSQIEGSGRTKKTFDILIWTETLSPKSFRVLDELQQLREYLGSSHPQGVAINLWIPNDFVRTHALLDRYAISTSGISVAVPNADVKQMFGELTPAGMCEV